MRPTTKDLADAAGVSLATVDRVLNDRPGVKDETVRRVNQAIERIGFVRNIAAANLARRRNHRLLFILPSSGDQFLDEVSARIAEANAAFASDMVSVEARHLDTNDPHGLAAFLGGLDGDEIDGVAIMAPETPQVRDAMARLIARGIHAVPFGSGQPLGGDSGFVGIDNHAAGATAAHLMGRFLGPRPGNLLTIAETIKSRDSLERRRGFDRVVNYRFSHLAVLPTLETYGDPARTERIVANAFTNHPGIVGVYVMSAEARGPLEALGAMVAPREKVVIAHERTPFTEAALVSDRIDAIIAQNPGHLVRSALRILRARLERREPLASQEKIRIEILLKENL